MENGRLKVWADPEPGAAYVIGADVAEGIELSAGTGERDNSCVQVLHRGRLEQAACWTGKIDPDVLADIIAFLAERYNGAFVGVEANNHGLTTITALKGRCPRMYRRERFDERSRIRTRKLGWLTTSRTRPMMIYTLASAIRDGEIAINEAATVAELMTFVYDRNGHMNAQEGCHDDRVFALAVALQMHQQAPPLAEEEERAHPAAERLECLRTLRDGGKGASRDGWNVV